jgi:hypothetical protein
MYSAIVNVCTYLKESNLVGSSTSDDTKTSEPEKPASSMSVSLKLDKLSVIVDLEDDGNECSVITVGVGDIDIRLINVHNLAIFI